MMGSVARQKQSRRFLDVECPGEPAWVRGREHPQQGCWWHKSGRRGWGSCWHPEIPEIHWFLYSEGHWAQESLPRQGVGASSSKRCWNIKSSLLQDTQGSCRQTFNTKPRFWPRNTMLFSCFCTKIPHIKLSHTIMLEKFDLTGIFVSKLFLLNTRLKPGQCREYCWDFLFLHLSTFFV